MGIEPVPGPKCRIGGQLRRSGAGGLPLRTFQLCVPVLAYLRLSLDRVNSKGDG
jgi:hypothetical protein